MPYAAECNFISIYFVIVCRLQVCTHSIRSFCCHDMIALYHNICIVEETLKVISQLRNLLLWIFGRPHIICIFIYNIFGWTSDKCFNAFLLHLTRPTTPHRLASDMFCCCDNCLACSLCPLLSLLSLCPSLYLLVLSPSFAASCSSKESDSEQEPDEEVTAILHFN